jgi:hypothetical protein
MATAQLPRDPFEAAIEAKIAAWTAVLEKYRAAVGLDGSLGEVTAPQPRQGAGGHPIELPVGVFRDKSIKEAIEIYLRAGRRHQTNKEIATGLQKGGIATTAANFEATIATALGRMKDEGTVLRFPDGWDLSASYPDSLRARLENPKARKTRRPKTPKPSKSRLARGDDKTALVQSVIDQAANGMTVGSIEDALSAIGIEASRDYIRVVTRRLVKRGLAERRQGKFYPPAAAAS